MKKLDSLSGFNPVGLEDVNLSGSTTRGINKLSNHKLKRLIITNTPNATEEWIRVITEQMDVEYLEMSKSLKIDPEMMASLKEKTKVVLK